MSVWERNFKGCFAGIVYHLRVVNKNSCIRLSYKGQPMSLEQEMGVLLLSCTTALLPVALCSSASPQALAAASRPHRACPPPASAILLSEKLGLSSPLLNVTSPFSFSLGNRLANGSASCCRSVHFSGWGFLLVLLCSMKLTGIYGSGGEETLPD